MQYPDEISDTAKKSPEFVSVASHDLREFLNGLVKDITDSGMLVIYIGITKPSEKLKGMFEDEGIDTKKILFFDMATKISGSAPDNVENTVFFESDDINQVNMRLDDAADSIPDGREAVLVFDTISTLTIYNDEETILQFLNSLTNKTEEWGMKSILVGVEAEMNENIENSVENSVSEWHELEDE